MKKIILMLLIAALSVSVVGCGDKKEEKAENEEKIENVEDTENEENIEKEETNQTEITDSVEILTTVWDKYDEALGEENMFPIGGGGYENMTMDAPGVVDPADTDSLTAMLSFPADSVDMIDDAASMMHAMNANTFTAAAYHLVDASNQQVLADALKESIMNTQWMCGFPELMVIAGINDDYVVTCIGNTDLVEIFKTNVAEIYGATILYEESLM